MCKKIKINDASAQEKGEHFLSFPEEVGHNKYYDMHIVITIEITVISLI